MLRRVRAQPREALRRRGQHRLGVGGAVEQAKHLEDFLGVEARALDAQLVDRPGSGPGWR